MIKNRSDVGLESNGTAELNSISEDNSEKQDQKTQI